MAGSVLSRACFVRFLKGGFVLTVVYVKDAERGYLRIGISDDEKKLSFILSEREYRESGEVRPRDEISSEELEFFSRCNMRYKARRKALNILSYGDNSERMLKQKLYTAGISRDIIDEVTEEMLSLGYINSERQISRLVINAVTLHSYGPGKIIPKLVSKGYDRSEVQRVISELVSRGDVDFSAARAKLLSTKLSEDADEEEKKKLLYKYGYKVF